MSVRVEKAGVAATISLFGGMTTAEFDLGDRVVQPLYTAPWDKWEEDLMLGHLRGDFLCVPFGISRQDLAGFPPGWRELPGGGESYGHGYSANAEWSLDSMAPGVAELSLDYPAGDLVGSVRRSVECIGSAVEFSDRILMREDAKLPIGLHPMFRLPEEAGMARLHLPACEVLATPPVATDDTSVLEPNSFFDTPSQAPMAAGGSMDLTSLPLTLDTEEVVLLCNVEEPRVVLDNLAEGYRVTLEWDAQYLKHCLLWISNRGRAFPPWNGRNLCIGIEPVTSAFDLGLAVSSAANPLAARGITTHVPLSAGRHHEIWHRIFVEELEPSAAID